MFDTTGSEANTTADNVNDNDVEVTETEVVDNDTDEGDVDESDDSDEDESDESDDSDDSEPQTKAKKTSTEEKPFRAWDFRFEDEEEPAQERTREQHVPYDRFAKVNTRVQELEQELASLRGTPNTKQATQQTTVSEQTLEDLYASFPVPEEFTDGKSFATALAKHQREIFNMQQELIQQRTAHQAHLDNVKRQSYETASHFLERATVAVKTNPEIANAVDVFTRISSKLHPDILHTIMSDDNGPELVHRITTNKDVFATIINSRRDFVGAVRALERMSIQAQQATKQKSSSVVSDKQTPTAKSVPRVIRTGETSPGPRTLHDLTPKQIANLSDKEYAKLRART